MSAAGIRLALGSLAAAALLAGCGGGGESGPASVVPPDAAFYAEATVRPNGELAADAKETLRRLTGESDPGAAITGFLDRELGEEDPGLEFDSDIKPWLGERAAVFFDELAANLEGALVVEATDTGAAERFARDLGGTSEGSEQQSYEGVDYTLGSRGEAVGVIDDFLVLGDEVAVKQAIDASQGDSLAGEDAFSDALDSVPEDSLADAYVRLDAVGDAASSDLGRDAEAFFGGLLGDVEAGDAATVSVVPRRDAIELDVSSEALAGLSAEPEARLLASLPGEAWGAAGVPDAARVLRALLAAVDASGQASVGELEAALGLAGLDLDADLIAPIARVAGFVQSGQEPITGALLISSSDGETSSGVVETLAGLLSLSGDGRPVSIGGGRGFSFHADDIGPQPIYVIARGDQVVVGYGRAATQRTLAGGDALSATPGYSEAKEALGADPIAYAAGPEALRVADAFGLLAEPGLADATPYLERLRFAALGVEDEDDRGTLKLVVGLQP